MNRDLTWPQLTLGFAGLDLERVCLDCNDFVRGLSRWADQDETDLFSTYPRWRVISSFVSTLLYTGAHNVAKYIRRCGLLLRRSDGTVAEETSEGKMVSDMYSVR